MTPCRKELQQLMRTLRYWRKFVPRYSIIAYLLYSLLWNREPWKWNPEHEEAVRNLIEELKMYQSLGPVYTTLLYVLGIYRKYSRMGLCWTCYCVVEHKQITGPDGPKKSLLFIRTTLKETKQRYSEWEKGVVSLIQAVKQAEPLKSNLTRKLCQDLNCFSFPGTILILIPAHLHWRPHYLLHK